MRTMLILAAAAMLTAGSVQTTRADYPAEVLALQPLSYWRFNENITSPAYDVAINSGSLGAAGSGLYTSGDAHPVAGAIVSQPSNTAAGFGGTGQAVRVPYVADLASPAAFTVEAWVKPAVSPPPAAQSSLAAVLSCGHLADPRSGWLVYQAAGGWNFRLYNQNGTATSLSITGGPTPVAGTWYHLVVVFDGTTGKVYVNGVETASGPATGYVPNPDAAFTIGTRSDSAFHYNGDVDEVAYYNTALSATQIAVHHANGINPTPATPYDQVVAADAPVGYWRLNEPAFVPPVAANLGSLGSVANGGYVGATNASGPSGVAFPGLEANNHSAAFNGTDAFVQAGSLALSGPLTIVAWVNPNDLEGEQAIAGENTSYAFKLNGSELRFTTPGILDHASAGAAVAIGDWQQVAVTFMPGTVGGAQFYMNGQLISAADASALNRATNVFWVGKDQWAGQEFNGAIDEVAVFDRILTAGNIMSLHFTAIGSSAAPFMLSDPPVVDPAGTIYTTTPFSLTPDVAGALPMYYQWRKDGANIPGATTQTFTKASAAIGDAGNYDLVITNAFGTVTSSGVTVAIDPAVPPTLDQQPVSRSVYSGGQASFAVVASGTQPIHYQWKHAGTNLPGATNATLLVADCTAASAGAYTVGLTNVAGGRLSSSATLTLITPVADSYEAIVVANNPVAYWRLNERSGTAAFDFQGAHDGTNTDTVVLGSAAPAAPSFLGLEAGNTCYLFNGADGYVEGGSLGLSGPLTISAWVKPNVLTGDRAIAGENASWAFKLLGSELRFTTPGVLDHTTTGASVEIGVWQHVVASFAPGTAGGARFYLNGNLVGAMDASALTKGNSTFWIGKNQWAGQFFNGAMDEVALYDQILPAETIATMYAVAAYGTTTPPFVTYDPADATVAFGGTVTLSGGIAGSVPMSFQWQKDGADLPGATAASLTLSNVFYLDSGSYALHASNGNGQTNTAAATLTVMPPPTFANLTNGLVLHLKFEDNFTDSSGLGHDGLTYSPPAFVPGRLGRGIECATVANTSFTYVQVFETNSYTPLPDLQFSTNVDFSVSYWVKFTGSPGDLPFICTANVSYGNQGLTFAPGYNTGTWSYYLGAIDGTGASLGSGYATQLINDGQWHLLTHTFDRTGNAVTYLNGVQVDSRSMVGVGDLDSFNLLTIGQDPTTGYGETATFQMDDVGIWRRALSAYEAQSIYGAAQNSGQSFDVYGPVKLYVTKAGPDPVIIWQAGTLQSAPTVNGPWNPVPNASAPSYKVTPGTNGNVFYRVRL